MTNQIIAMKLTDQSAHDALEKCQPALLASVRAALAGGVSAEQIERHLMEIYGPGNLVALTAATAAYYLEGDDD